MTPATDTAFTPAERSLGVRLQTAAVRALFALPGPARDLLAWPPVRVEGLELAKDARLALRLLRWFGPRPTTRPLAKTRAAVERSRHILREKTAGAVAARDVVIPTAWGRLTGTLYTPPEPDETTGLLVYFHGGGWVAGSRHSHDALTRFLARHAGVRILSVDYRLAPEHPFPAALDDALAAFDHAVDHASDWGARSKRIGVGGDSAGGNLAAAVAQLATARGGAAPAFQLLLYPNLDLATRRRSHELFGKGFSVTEQELSWAIGHYAPADVDRRDPRLSPLYAATLDGLPPAYVALAGFDVLFDEGEEYVARLQAAGVPTQVVRHDDLIHGFASLTNLSPRCRTATYQAALALRAALAEPRCTASPPEPCAGRRHVIDTVAMDNPARFATS